jgi:hypothetical protein
MGQLIMAHEGTLECFVGDGMMVIFNGPVPLPNHQERAVRMALAMRGRFQELSAAWRKLGYDIGMGIGIAQGYATIGEIGFVRADGLRLHGHGVQSRLAFVRRGASGANPRAAAIAGRGRGAGGGRAGRRVGVERLPARRDGVQR